jgi:sugar phosphate isomerase/epimerase
MQFAYSSNAYRRWSIREAAERIAEIGYPGIEVMADMPHAWPPNLKYHQVAALRSMLEKRELIISNVNAFMMTAVGDFWHPSWIDPDPEDRRLRLQHTIDSLRLARDLGAKCITTEPGGPLPEGVTRERALAWFLEGLHAALPVAEETGVMLLVEPEPDLLIENSDQFLELAATIRSPMFGLNFDIGHFYCVNEPLAEAIELLKGFTRHYHVEDIAASRVHEHLIPGRGAIDFAEVLGAIRATGYKGWLTVELYPYLDDLQSKMKA